MPAPTRPPKKHRDELTRRAERHKAFYARRDGGDLLVLPNPWTKVNLAARLARALGETPIETFLRDEMIHRFVAAFLADFRADHDAFYAIPGDAVPTAPVFPHMGSVTAGMTHLTPTCANRTVTLTADLSWDEIEKLRFDADNPWVQLPLKINRALWEMWDEDFFIMPYFYRTPLDAAQGIRGGEIFTDMYDDPQRVKKLIDFCADWNIAMHRFLHANIQRPHQWGSGVWNCYAPDRSVIANGDAVAMIAREMHPTFERPYTEKFFTATGGGVFHNHSIGLHQVDLVAATRGVILQEIMPDPNRPDPVKEMLTNGELAGRMVSSSLVSPIRLDGIAPDDLERLLPIVKEGRFILAVPCDDPDQQHRIVDTVRRESNIE